ncbi:hypothetical protein FGL91_15080 [Microbacterium sp. CBA3102]|uniref:hypothetical protein n=1 Tax=Microbacterium sp. CBA3102 TaxID=2603598 RepID=UPI0011BB4301|nr:hypothetical protein [Microbacterium sp. CBA3102]QEA29759.1 hypothetical protein FGL91_15080 [Microbacterium sp. CBA3102]
MASDARSVSERWEALPRSLRHPKNLAFLALEILSPTVDRNCRITIISTQPWTGGLTYVEVRIPGGVIRDVAIEAEDDPSSLAARIDREILYDGKGRSTTRGVK